MTKEAPVPHLEVTGATGQRNERFCQALGQDEKPQSPAIQELQTIMPMLFYSPILLPMKMPMRPPQIQKTEVLQDSTILVHNSTLRGI